MAEAVNGTDGPKAGDTMSLSRSYKRASQFAESDKFTSLDGSRVSVMGSGPDHVDP